MRIFVSMMISASILYSCQSRSSKSPDLKSGIYQQALPQKANDVMSKVTTKKSQTLFSQDEIDQGIKLLLTETKKEALAIKKSIQFDPDGKNKLSNKTWEIANNVLKNSNEEILKYLISDDYKKFREEQKEIKVNTIKKEDLLGLTSPANQSGFFLTEGPPKGAVEQNNTGSTWMIATGLLTSVIGLGIANITVGAIIKATQNAGKEDSDLITAGKTLNIVQGSLLAVSGISSTLWGTILISLPAKWYLPGIKYVGAGTAVLGVALLAVGISQIIAGAEMGQTGLTDSTLIDKTKESKSLERLRHISGGVHRLLDLRAQAPL